MSQLSDDEKRRLFTTLDLHTKQNEKLERALYGDPPNKVKGLLEEMAEVKTWILKMKMKITFFTGVGITLGFIGNRVWDWLVGKH